MGQVKRSTGRSGGERSWIAPARSNLRCAAIDPIQKIESHAAQTWRRKLAAFWARNQKEIGAYALLTGLRHGPALQRTMIRSLHSKKSARCCHAEILMARSEDKHKIDSLYYTLPADLRERVLIELVIGTDLLDSEPAATFNHLMTEFSPSEDVGSSQ